MPWEMSNLDFRVRSQSEISVVFFFLINDMHYNTFTCIQCVRYLVADTLLCCSQILPMYADLLVKSKISQLL